MIIGNNLKEILSSHGQQLSKKGNRLLEDVSNNKAVVKEDFLKELIIFVEKLKDNKQIKEGEYLFEVDGEIIELTTFSHVKGHKAVRLRLEENQGLNLGIKILGATATVLLGGIACLGLWLSNVGEEGTASRLTKDSQFLTSTTKETTKSSEQSKSEEPTKASSEKKKEASSDKEKITENSTSSVSQQTRTETGQTSVSNRDDSSEDTEERTEELTVVANSNGSTAVSTSNSNSTNQTQSGSTTQATRTQSSSRTSVSQPTRSEPSSIPDASQIIAVEGWTPTPSQPVTSEPVVEEVVNVPIEVIFGSEDSAATEPSQTVEAVEETVGD